MYRKNAYIIIFINKLRLASQVYKLIPHVFGLTFQVPRSTHPAVILPFHVVDSSFHVMELTFQFMGLRFYLVEFDDLIVEFLYRGIR